MTILETSCKSHVFYLRSNLNANSVKSTISDETDSAYVFENDTIKITYNLWENRGQMSFAIYNKLNMPIFIDWKNSSFIMDDMPIPYWVDKTNMATSSIGYNYKGFSTHNSSGIMIHDDRVTIVPPHSVAMKIYDGYLCLSNKPVGIDERKHFRNYIAYSVNEDTKNESFSDSDFQVAQVKVIKKNKLNTSKSQKRFYTIH